MNFIIPQADIDRCLAIEASVKMDEMDSYLDCMNSVPMSVRVKSPRPLDGEGRDVRDGCILTGVFVRCYRPSPVEKPKPCKRVANGTDVETVKSILKNAEIERGNLNIRIEAMRQELSELESEFDSMNKTIRQMKKDIALA